MQNGAKSGYKCKRPKIKCKQRFLPLSEYGQTTEEIQAPHGVYTPPPSWSVCPLPASTSEEWLALVRTMNKRTPFWRNKRLAYIFDDGWDMATFQG